MFLFQFKSLEGKTGETPPRFIEYSKTREIISDSFKTFTNQNYEKLGGKDNVKRMQDQLAKDSTLENAKRLLEPYGLYAAFLIDLQQAIREAQKVRTDSNPFLAPATSLTINEMQRKLREDGEKKKSEGLKRDEAIMMQQKKASW